MVGKENGVVAGEEDGAWWERKREEQSTIETR